MTSRGGWIRDPEPLPDVPWPKVTEAHYPYETYWIIPREVTDEIYRRWRAARQNLTA